MHDHAHGLGDAAFLPLLFGLDPLLFLARHAHWPLVVFGRPAARTPIARPAAPLTPSAGPHESRPPRCAGPRRDQRPKRLGIRHLDVSPPPSREPGARPGMSALVTACPAARRHT